MEDKTKEKLIEVEIEDFKKVGDFWATHNISTRIMMVTFALSFIMVVIAGLMGTVVSLPIIDMVFYSALIGFGVVTLGINGIKVLLDGIAKIKLSK